MTAGRNKNARTRRYSISRAKAYDAYYSNRRLQKQRTRARKRKYKG